MALSLSRRADRIAKADIRNMTVECERVKGINLAQGVCDLELPEPVVKAAQRAIAEGPNAYTRHDGIACLREAIARKMAEFNGITADAEREVVVSGGSTGGLYCACLALLDPGDEVILFEPYYGYHLNTLLAVQAVPRFVRMQPPEWRYRIEDVEAAITPRTKALLINTPGNPTGRIYSRRELEELGELALRHELFVLSDEIYEYFVYGERDHISPGSLPGMGERTITISGYSKAFSITGWRIGYAVADARWAEMIGYVNDLVYVCAPAPLQVGVAEGIRTLGRAYFDGLKAEFSKKRATLCTALREAGFEFVEPAGAYYVLADAARLPGADGRGRAMYLLEEAGVASVPGSSFYHDGSGETLLRFCFAKADKELHEAAARLRRVCVGRTIR
jgi:aminotransferase